MKSTSTFNTQPALAITSKSCFLFPQQNRKLKLGASQTDCMTGNFMQQKMLQ